MPLSRSPSAYPECSRRAFLQESAAVGATLAAITGAEAQEIRTRLNSHNGEPSRNGEPKKIRLRTGRIMEFKEFGVEGGIPCIFVHGLLGSGDCFAGTDDMLREFNLRVIAPNLYGRRTDWRKRNSVAQSGEDIAALSESVYGADVAPCIAGCSAGGKDAIAAAIAFNRRNDQLTVPVLHVISAQMDLLRGDVFDLLSPRQQRDLNTILGRAKQARIPLLQPLRNLGARLKQRVAHRIVQEQAGTEEIASANLVTYLSRSDREIFERDADFKTMIFGNASAYSFEEIIDSIQKLCGWNLDLSMLKGTNVKIIHGTDDQLVHPQNARILEEMLKQAGVDDVQVLFFPDGHLLFKGRARQIGEMMVKNSKG